jgi:hypothetical protein
VAYQRTNNITTKTNHVNPITQQLLKMETQTTLLSLAILLFLTSTWFVVTYAKRSTSFFILLLSIASFGLGSAAVALLPIDLSYASTADDTNTSNDANNAANDNDTYDNTDITNNPTYLPWQITYWTTFILAWLILPITRESLLSGHFSLQQRFKDGVAKSIRGIMIMICMGTVTIIGMAIHLKSVRLVTTVLPVLMALGNTYGLVLVAVLLGNGLVNIPKKFWREACPASELRRVRIMACGAEEELFEAIMNLEDVEERIEEVCANAINLREDGGGGEAVGMMENEDGGISLRTRRGRARRCGLCCCRVDEVTQFHESLEELVRRKNETLELNSDRRTRRGNASSRNRDNDEGNAVNTMDLNYLVSLNAQLKRAQERVTSAQLRWNHLMDHSRLFASLMDDESDEALTGTSGGGSSSNASSLLSSTPSSACCCNNKIQYTLQKLWVQHLRYHAYRIIAIVTAVLSAFVLLSEVTLAVPLNLSPFSWTLHALDNSSDSTHQKLFQIAALIPLLYMSICVYTCLFQMSSLSSYCLRGNRQSHGVALIFNAQYLVRLQFPLGYNYLLM